jgi:hypothetical protein
MESLFSMPKPVNIMGRASSITNSFVNGIILIVQPTKEEILEALDVLKMDPTDVRCAYCGDKSTEWDHLRPLVLNQRPTGYISEIANLAPACGKCNQSKGNKPWREWINSGAARSPRSRGVRDLETRIDHLVEYENWRDVQPLNFASIVGNTEWSQHWENWQRVLDEMRRSQEFAAHLRATIKRWHHFQ